MKYKIEDMGKVIANAKLLNHTHINLNPFEKMIYTGYKTKNGWEWFEFYGEE